jgi:Protein of unknown function (DUF2778)
MQYKQSTGQFFDRHGKLLGTGWAGNGKGKNNPLMQETHNVGPLCRGWYIIEKPYDSPHTGPFTLTLTPYSDTELFGRSEFKIHGSAANVDKDGFITVSGKKQPVSEGCIIQERAVRENIWKIVSSEDINIMDKDLEVIE